MVRDGISVMERDEMRGVRHAAENKKMRQWDGREGGAVEVINIISGILYAIVSGNRRKYYTSTNLKNRQEFSGCF